MSTRIPWTRVIVEGGVIVLSILLAFGIDAAWERSQELEAERQYLELLVRDLGLMADELNGAIAFDAIRADGANRAYDALSGGPGLEDEELSAALTLATQRRTLNLPRATITDLISTGNLRIIRNAELRDAIVRFYEDIEWRYEVLRKNSEVYVDGLMVDAVFGQGLIRGSFPSPETTSFQYRGYQERPDPIWSLPRDASELDRVRSALHVRGLGDGFGDFMVVGVQQAEDLSTRIQSELEGRWPR